VLHWLCTWLSIAFVVVDACQAEFSMLDIMMISSMERIGAGVVAFLRYLLFCYICCDM
jgi:hypothetical protein